MVSPFKIAREAALDKTAGGTKFLGEKLFEKFEILLRSFLQQAVVLQLAQTWHRAPVSQCPSKQARPGLNCTSQPVY